MFEGLSSSCHENRKLYNATNVVMGNCFITERKTYHVTLELLEFYFNSLICI